MFSSTGAAAAAMNRPVRVQHARDQRRQRDEQDIGKGDPAVGDRQLEALVAGKARGHRQTSPGMKTMPSTEKTVRISAMPVKASRAKSERLLAGFELLGEHRHEGHVEGALGEEAAEHVGQREGDQEGLGHRPGAQIGGDQDVAGKAQNAASRVQTPTVKKAGHQPDRVSSVSPLRR